MKITTKNIAKVFNKNPKRHFTNEELVNVDWISVSKDYNLSSEFIQKFKDKISWYFVSKYQKLCSKIVKKFNYDIDWINISAHQKLSFKTIESFSEDLCWDLISICQKLSPKFIEKFADKVNWYAISKYQKLPKWFREKYANRLTLPDPQYNTLYWTESQLLDLVKQSPYEVKNGYIYAWKAVRKDRYSLYNFQYHYEKGKTYSAHCDCNLRNDSSFGLSAWTKEKAEEYGKETNQPYKIIRVKIAVKDIGVILKNHNWKIRCRKFTVIS